MVANTNTAAADLATRTSVELLDALIDSMVLVRPGMDASRFAGDIRRLGDSAAHAAYELCTLIEQAQDDPVIEVPLPPRSKAA